MRINLIVVRTKNTKKLAEFYERLGIEFEYHQHGKGPFHYSSKLDRTVFEIYPLLKRQEKADKSLRLGFDVKELDKLISTLDKEGFEIVSRPTKSEWGYFAVIKDLDGRKIELKNAEQLQKSK